MRNKGSLLKELPILVVIALVVSLFIKSFLVQFFYIPSGSMENTLQIKDRVAVNKVPFISDNIKRGDVVVFRDPNNWLPEPYDNTTNQFVAKAKSALVTVGVLPNPAKQYLVKRVVGVGGDRVVCCTKDGKLTINGVEVTEPYIFAGNKPSEMNFDVTVPKGKLWVMGDHRGASADSRYHQDDEQLLANAGISPIAGVDEAGRGACAGPLVIASVVLNDPFAPELAVVRDSKEIAENKRDAVFDLIHHVAVSVSVVIVPASEVDSRGVHAANLDGMRRAVQGLSVEPAYVLTDGYAIEGLGVPNLAVWKGDQVVVSISAASVIAKVSRDRIMREMDLEFPQYGFAGHKGYITAAHTKALNEHGPCAQHRQSFANVAALIHK